MIGSAKEKVPRDSKKGKKKRTVSPTVGICLVITSFLSLTSSSQHDSANAFVPGGFLLVYPVEEYD